MLRYTFNTPKYRLEWHTEPEDYFDLSWDETGEVAEKIESGEYQCFNSEVRLIDKTTDRIVGQDFLSESIYSNPQDFRMGSGYFWDMARQCISQAREA